MSNFEIVMASPELMALTEAAQDLGIRSEGVDQLVRIGAIREYVNAMDAAERLVVCCDVTRIAKLAAVLRDYPAEPPTDPDPETPEPIELQPQRDGFAA